MRYVLGFVLVLALGLMGCSETAGTGGSGSDGGIGGDGGSAGMGGGGVGGDGGVGGAPVTDCTGEPGDTRCVFGETPGHCADGVCFVSDCSGVEDLTPCWESVFGVGIDYSGACVGGECESAVGNCTDPADEGTPCWLSEDPAAFGFCEAGVCEPQN